MQHYRGAAERRSGRRRMGYFWRFFLPFIFNIIILHYVWGQQLVYDRKRGCKSSWEVTAKPGWTQTCPNPNQIPSQLISSWCIFANWLRHIVRKQKHVGLLCVQNKRLTVYPLSQARHSSFYTSAYRKNQQHLGLMAQFPPQMEQRQTDTCGRIYPAIGRTKISPLLQICQKTRKSHLCMCLHQWWWII